MGAFAARPQSLAENPAIIAALLAEVASLALRALIDDGRLGETAREDDRGLVGDGASESETALAAGGRAPDPP